MRQLLFQFLDADLPAFNGPPLQKQILSLGAGFDTSFFQLVVRELHCRCSLGIQIEYGSPTT
jgi:tRNA wybutosine-synthesizing protein 4